MRRHMIDLHVEPEARYMCNACDGKILLNRTALYNHLHRVHPSSKGEHEKFIVKKSDPV